MITINNNINKENKQYTYDIGIINIGKVRYSKAFQNRLNTLKDKYKIKTYDIIQIDQKEQQRGLGYEIDNVIKSALSQCDKVITCADIFSDLKYDIVDKAISIDRKFDL